MRLNSMWVSGLALAAALGSVAQAADHREAITINEFPSGDLNDIYVFEGERPSRIVLIMTVNPIADPDFAGSYTFSPDILYRFSISNTGDSRPEINIDFTFTPVAGGVQTFTAFTPAGRITGQTTSPTVLSTTPNAPVITEQNGVTIFAGPRDDPFFFDGTGFQRVLNGGSFRGIDSFASFNVSAIVMELPLRLLRGGETGPIEVTGVTYSTFQSDSQADLDAPSRRRAGVEYFQLDRTGVPAVSTALVPGAQRNAFNYAPIRGDGDFFAGIDFTDVIVNSLTNTFGTSAENIAILASVAVPDTLKYDPSAADGFPNGRQPEDDVADVLLSLILNDPAAGDGVDANDRPFLTAFPYLGEPQQAQ